MVIFRAFNSSISCWIIAACSMTVSMVNGFQQMPCHHHPLYVRYRQEHLERQHHHDSHLSSQQNGNQRQNNHGILQQQQQQQDQQKLLQTSASPPTSSFPPMHLELTPSPPSTPIAYDVDTGMAMVSSVRLVVEDDETIEKNTSSAKNTNNFSLSTPVSYDRDTGMVQTAVRALVQHPVMKQSSHLLVNNAALSVSSTLVISLGAMHEFVDCIELEWAHHATSSTEGLALLSLGHFFHYGRETVKQLLEYHEEQQETTASGGSGEDSIVVAPVAMKKEQRQLQQQD